MGYFPLEEERDASEPVKLRICVGELLEKVMELPLASMVKLLA